MPSHLEAAFNQAMLDIYHRAKAEAGYPATRFLRMVVDRGGLETARHLLHGSEVSEGYVALYMRGRLDLTVEAMILASRWKPLFSDEERRIAVARLKKYEYQGQLPKID
ncbi:MAG: hypothetical protein Q8R91_10020 [Candidatus Omnitrophota bacterium]|nr:hypothetical protein [Candidatus Omnitrophota bacterium]